MSSLSDRLIGVFELIVETYDQQPAEHRRRLLHHRTFSGERFIGWDDSAPFVTRDDLDEMQELGLVDIDYSLQHGDYLVKPTSDGRRSLRTFRREIARSEQPQRHIDLAWPAVRPVLHAVVDLWTEAGAPVGGFVTLGDITERIGRDENDLATQRAVEALARDDWLDAAYEGEADELQAAPTVRGLAATRGWPGGDAEAAAERLLSALDEIETSAADEATRGWAARARDTLMEVGTKTLAEVVSKSVGGAL